MVRPLPGIVEQIRAVGLTSAFFYGWDSLRNLCTPGVLTYAFFREKRDLDNDDTIAAAAIQGLTSQQPDFAFIHFDTVDGAGHQSGWLSEAYLAQVTQVDAALGRVINALPQHTTIIVQSDHGGHERTHGTDSPADMTIPWLIAGPTIRSNHPIQAPVNLLSTAPTIAHILQIPPAAEWEGEAVAEVFSD
jgi:predicted AlkP superfamily pyrophosphatase or phosphodiesterase